MALLGEVVVGSQFSNQKNGHKLQFFRGGRTKEMTCDEQIQEYFPEYFPHLEIHENLLFYMRRQTFIDLQSS